MDSIITTIFNARMETLNAGGFFITMIVALLLGGFFVKIYIYKNIYTKSFAMTLGLLPSIVCVVILMVNGNLGTGIAVAGAFSLVRFRSVPGTAKEIGGIFISMAMGLILGTGYLAYAVLFAVIISIAYLFYAHLDYGIEMEERKVIRVTIPEDLNYTTIFDDLFDEYAKEWKLFSVKTTNLGSLYKLEYQMILKDIRKEKELIDEMRCRNGNLEISTSIQSTVEVGL